MAIDSYSAGVLLILGTVSFSVVGLLLVRKKMDVATLKECHEVGGYLLAVVGTLYAVLLGLVVIDAMNRFQQAQITCQQEANALADIYLLAGRMPQDHEIEIKKICMDYVNNVTNQEWPLMDDGKFSPECRSGALKLMKTLNHYEPKSSSEAGMYQNALSEACMLWDNRRARVNSAQYGTPPEEWVVLLVGGIVTIIFTYFFGLDNLRLQMVMTGMISLLIGLNLLLVLWFGYPFSGDRKVHPTAFQVDKEIFTTELTESGLRLDAPFHLDKSAVKPAALMN